ncbi:MAG TPA: hypothetical protein VGW35_24900 [Methylomirabilota bacterium]|jgi:hypothetical protein|nr:hypothetical protein [Methylomirabilota bacterium]
MIEFIHHYSSVIESANGKRYVARVYADQQPAGLWEAWFVFFPLDGGGAVASDRETTQSKREDVLYWTGGITSTYLQGALRRALDRLPEARLLRHIAQAELEETYKRAEADAYQAAAEEALARARAAEARRREAERQLEGLDPASRGHLEASPPAA